MSDVFFAQTRNVRGLTSAVKNLDRLINAGLIKRDESQVGILTKLLCVTFNFWAEARFSKLIHTPYGFSDTQRRQIRFDSNGRESSIESRWAKCIATALSTVPRSRRTNEIPNCRQRLERIVQDVVIAPSKMRNKIAHGQWEIALNAEHTATNDIVTAQIRDVDCITIGTWFDVFEHLAQIVENAIESPTRTHRRDYWQHIVEIETILENRKKMTVREKQARLIAAKERAKAKWL
jgi:hypothetical protein